MTVQPATQPATAPTTARATTQAATRATVPKTRGQNQRRQRIVHAAAALASRGGVEAMRMRTVAERAGVALGTLYRYFPSKSDLMVAVVAEELDALETSVVRHPPRAHTPARRAVDLLTRTTRSLMREPELADALVRSLLLSTTESDFGPRMTRMLLRVTTGDPETATDREHALAEALTSVWIMHLREVLTGHATIDQIHHRLEPAADRLVGDFSPSAVPGPGGSRTRS